MCEVDRQTSWRSQEEIVTDGWREECGLRRWRWILRGKVGTEGGVGCVEVGIGGCEDEVGTKGDWKEVGIEGCEGG